MITYQFTAICGEQKVPLEVQIEYKPGKQAQRARRVAVGELLAFLGAQGATVDATGEDMVKVTTKEGIWIIGESHVGEQARARF